MRYPFSLFIRRLRHAHFGALSGIVRLPTLVLSVIFFIIASPVLLMMLLANSGTLRTSVQNYADVRIEAITPDYNADVSEYFGFHRTQWKDDFSSSKLTKSLTVLDISRSNSIQSNETRNNSIQASRTVTLKKPLPQNFDIYTRSHIRAVTLSERTKNNIARDYLKKHSINSKQSHLAESFIELNNGIYFDTETKVLRPNIGTSNSIIESSTRKENEKNIKQEEASSKFSPIASLENKFVGTLSSSTSVQSSNNIVMSKREENSEGIETSKNAENSKGMKTASENSQHMETLKEAESFQNTEILKKAFGRKVVGSDKTIMLDLAKTFDQLIRGQLNITYVMYSGTLLGSFRHHDIIPWDDDVDLIADIRERVVIVAALERLYPRYQVFEAGPRLKFFSAHSRRKGRYPWNWPYLDVHFYTSNFSHIWDSAPEFHSYVYPRSSMFPTHLRPLGGLRLSAPRDSLACLRLTYRASLQYCESIVYSHELERVVTSAPLRVNCRELENMYPFVHRERIGGRGLIPSPVDEADVKLLRGKGEVGVRETVVIGDTRLTSLVVEEPCDVITDPFTLELLPSL